MFDSEKSIAEAQMPRREESAGCCDGSAKSDAGRIRRGEGFPGRSCGPRAKSLGMEGTGSRRIRSGATPSVRRS